MEVSGGGGNRGFMFSGDRVSGGEEEKALGMGGVMGAP